MPPLAGRFLQQKHHLSCTPRLALGTVEEIQHPFGNLQGRSPRLNNLPSDQLPRLTEQELLEDRGAGGHYDAMGLQVSFHFSIEDSKNDIMAKSKFRR